MKKLMYVFAIGSMFAFASCDSPAEERAEEREDIAEERADEMEDMEEEMDTTAVIE